MFNFLKKKTKISNSKFIAISLLAFLVFLAILIIVLYFSKQASLEKIAKEIQKTQQTQETDSQYVDISEDPFITSPRKLEDLQRTPNKYEHNPVLGNKDAPVTIFYYSDYTCQYCHEQEKILKQVVENYPEKVKLVWKDYTYPDTNSLSWQSSLYAKCAQKQNKFWEFHNLLQEQINIFRETEGENLTKFKQFLEGISQPAGLNIKELNKCLENPEIENKIKQDIKEANKLNIIGVPYTYIGDKDFLGKMTNKEIENVINFQINE